LTECNRRLEELREGIGAFLKQSLESYVYWVERAGKTQRNLSLLAAPIEVADYLRRRLFGPETSVILTTATLATVNASPAETAAPAPARGAKDGASAGASGLDYFALRIGGESAKKLQVGSPFDYERQMRIFVPKVMPEPREEGYRDALIHWIQHFIKQTHGKA